jgi:hypothetical protein
MRVCRRADHHRIDVGAGDDLVRTHHPRVSFFGKRAGRRGKRIGDGRHPRTIDMVDAAGMHLADASAAKNSDIEHVCVRSYCRG